MAPKFDKFETVDDVLNRRAFDGAMMMLQAEEAALMMVDRIQTELELLIVQDKHLAGHLEVEVEAGAFDLTFEGEKPARVAMLHCLLHDRTFEVTAEEAICVDRLRAPQALRTYARYLLYRVKREADLRAWETMRDAAHHARQPERTAQLRIPPGDDGKEGQSMSATRATDDVNLQRLADAAEGGAE